MTQPPIGLDEAISRIRDIPEAEAGISPEGVADHGRFEGLPAKIALEDDGRSATLLEPISYVSAAETEWPVPSGAWLDGASIPRAFWSIIGGPFEGRYREPSIVHDHFCITRTRTWRDTHRMFHTAMLCRRVSGFKARIMYYAVYRFGPRWPDPDSIAEAAVPAPPEIASDAVAESVWRDAEILRDAALDVEAIERLADRHTA